MRFGSCHAEESPLSFNVESVLRLMKMRRIQSSSVLSSASGIRVRFRPFSSAASACCCSKSLVAKFAFSESVHVAALLFANGGSVVIVTAKTGSTTHISERW